LIKFKEEERGRDQRLRLEPPVMKKSDEINDLRPAPRMAAEDRRQQILDVAVKLFSQKGFRGTTTKEIALAAGVNEAIIFRHFATKSDLYAAIIDGKAGSAKVKAVQNAIKEGVDSRDDRKLFESVAFHLLEFHEHDDTAMRLLLYSALEGHELAEMIFRNHISKAQRQLADYVKRRISEGAFRRVDPGSAVRGFLGMIINHIMHKKFFRYEGNEALNITNRQAAERMSELFLASMTNRNYKSVKNERRNIIS
jgi:AcrR family transcriptional regulator